jgi:transcriptional regulator with XRE-family HTH domain
MAKKKIPHSHYAREAAVLLGQIIRKARIERKITTEELAGRAGISRGLLRRIENGDLGCTIGAVFEVAATVGVRLFDADQATLTNAIASNKAIMALLPKTAHTSRVKVDDDF